MATGGTTAGRALRRGGAIGAAFAHDPREAWERTLDQLAERREHRRGVRSYEQTEGWERELHRALDIPYPCAAETEFEQVWLGIVEAFRSQKLAFGRAAFGGWDDADAALARAMWCLVRHTVPEVVVETGVGRGVTTRVILEAMARDGRGHLWSIDLPPLLERDLAAETAAIVTPRQADRWTLARGSSRVRLGHLLRRVGRVDVFLHDSFHTERNLLFEWETVLPLLGASGFLVADDVHSNDGLASFRRQRPWLRPLVCAHDDGRGLFAVVRCA
jgi:hypothetical protein